MKLRWGPRSASFRLSCAAVLLGLVCLTSFRSAEPPPVTQVRLAVLVVFDQLRGDYVASPWRDLFVPDGFRRLQEEGAWFQNCHYPYAHTVTGAGHASLLTGCSPDRHGIVNNDWYDRSAGSQVYCVAERYEQVPASRGMAGFLKKRIAGAGSPGRLLAPTVGDELKRLTGGKAQVVSMSFKDRSAVLPAGHKADACYWLDTTTGTFITSTFYRATPHAWVAEFNRGRPADRWFARDWERLRSDLDYERYTGPDDGPGEGKGFAQGLTFPHPMTGGGSAPGIAYYSALYNSPFGNELLLELVQRAIDAEQLGQRDVADLLCVSFSCNDPIGHCWGPDSQEVLDVTLRSDLIVRQLLATLDERVGRGKYLLALTADHGVCPLPEASWARGREAARIGPDLLSTQANGFLNEAFPAGGPARWVEAAVYPWIYLNQRVLRDRRLEPAKVEQALADWLCGQPGIQTAYTGTQLLQGVSPEDTIGQRVRRSFHPERSGDVTVVLKPYHLLTSPLATGTTHGSPHPYDTHVPLLVYGPGIPGGPRSEAVTPQAIAAIFARGLNIPPPALAEAPVPRTLLRP
jgi:hypothetical protein